MASDSLANRSESRTRLKIDFVEIEFFKLDRGSRANEILELFRAQRRYSNADPHFAHKISLFRGGFFGRFFVNVVTWRFHTV